jgi:lipopolysaccharide transport system permease protein
MGAISGKGIAAPLTFNPSFAVIDVVRAPLLGASAEANSWIVLFASTILGCVNPYLRFARFRLRIGYWV